MQDTVVYDGELTLQIQGDADADLLLEDSAEVGVFTALRQILPIYEGAVTVTPSAEAQTLSTANKSLMSDITINPIPDNYGLITWDGTSITVS